MDSQLNILVNTAKAGNKDSLMEILIMFNPLIKKYSRKLNYDGADTDLIICLIKTINYL